MTKLNHMTETDSNSKRKVLLLGSNDQAALITARSIRKYLDLYIYIVYWSQKELANYSNACKGSLYFGDPQIDYIGFINKFIEHIVHNIYDVLIPIDDPANELVYNNYEVIVKHIIVAGPSPKSYRKVHSKYEAANISKKINIKVPNFYLIENNKDFNLASINFFPIFAKPEFSWILKNNFLHYRLAVTKINNIKELEVFINDNILKCRIMLQKKIDGYGVGLNIFAIEGKVINYCINVRLHEPQNGGGSSFRKTMPLSQKLKQYADLIAAETNWTGLMMIEFKFNGEDYYLMEINPRPWGSIGLSVFSGINFPVILVDYFIFGKYNPKDNYRIVYSRNLLKDFRWILSRLIKDKELDLRSWLQFSMIPANVLLRRETLDVESLRDPLPMLMQFIILIKNKVIDKIIFKIRTLHNKFKYKNKFTKNFEPIQVSSHDKILFVCKGNVNRSVFAQKYTEKKYGINADSAGTLLLSCRKANPSAISLAEQEYNLNLNSHTSKCMAELLENIANFKYIFVFDFFIYTKVVDLIPNHKNKIFLLSSKEIVDPQGGSEQDYKICFSDISKQIDILFASNEKV